ncbi:MAG TPA: SDR family oxidoreductase [Streptosporangiaceae bacterium]|nr:SDR family oxidoreductase [Streptosporangiaceae bacterium]
MPTSSSGESSQPSGELFSVSGKVAVVTGGSRGIGAMIAGGLVRAGCRVYITARKAEACDAKAAELSAFGECISIPLDLAVQGSADELVRTISEREDRLHILVNNAGATWGAPLEEYPLDAFDKVLNINVKALFELTVRSLPLLRAAASAADPARVINIGSIDGLGVPTMESYAYSTSKAGVHMLTRHLASRLASESITVNAIAPGPFDSKMMAFALDDPQTRAAIASNVPLGRIGEPDDVAGTAIFLASRAGRYLTGAVIPVDGGIAALRR